VKRRRRVEEERMNLAKTQRHRDAKKRRGKRRK
jgi:hypothetical protein